MLRKFHASTLYNDGMSLDKVNDLQGKSKNSTDEVYFMTNPADLKQEYIQHLPVLSISKEVEKITVKSPEFLKLENTIVEKDEKIKDYEKLIYDIDERLRNIEKKEENFKENDFEDLLI